ncbi:MAG: amidohydrolase [Candidatus Tectomicrobia bacterium]|nr:amidohydrolase [Candidatus Tectomicrobia bacterium]
MRIDVQNHFQAAEFAARLAKRTSLPTFEHRNGMWWSKLADGLIIPFTPQLIDMEKKTKEMLARGVDVAILSISMPGPELLGGQEAEDMAAYGHDALAAIIKQDPAHYWGYATLGFGDMDSSLKELDRCIRQLGFRGAQLFANINGRTVDHAELRPFFARMHEYDLPIFLHPTRPLNMAGMQEFHLMACVGFLFDTTLAALRIIHAGIFEEFPGIKIVLPHIGSIIPYVLGRIDNIAAVPGSKSMIKGPVSEQFKNFYLDTVTYHQEAMDMCYRMFGADRLLYGSDYPYAQYPITLKVIEGLACGAEERERIYHKNAAALYTSTKIKPR